MTFRHPKESGCFFVILIKNGLTVKPSTPFVFRTSTIGYPILFVLCIWIVFWAEFRFGFDLTVFGIRPRTIEGLRGVLFSPFIHGDIEHLFNNTIPLFVLSLALIYFYREVSFKILLYGTLLTGILTWLIGRESYHIGASGVIYLLASFLFFKGILSKHYRLVALSLIVVFVYGGMVWFVTPIDPAISWEGHLSGLVTGLLFAFIFKKQIVAAPKYQWQKEDYDEENDPFMKHFDENGNFIETLPEDEVEEELKVNYEYREKRD